MKIRQALDDPDMSSDQVSRIISTEPVLSAQVLSMMRLPFSKPSKEWMKVSAHVPSK
jgi:hypothetical protein